MSKTRLREGISVVIRTVHLPHFFWFFTVFCTHCKPRLAFREDSEDHHADADDGDIAARAALKRKKQHEHSLDQTTAQIATLEQQIYSIEAANINQETLKAMQKAGKAMKEIHGGLTIDKVDETMYVLVSPSIA